MHNITVRVESPFKLIALYKSVIRKQHLVQSNWVERVNVRHHVKFREDRSALLTCSDLTAFHNGDHPPS